MLNDDMFRLDVLVYDEGDKRDYESFERIKKFCEEALKPSHNSQSDAIALLEEIIRSADLFGHYHLTAGCGDYERINAVLTQQHT